LSKERENKVKVNALVMFPVFIREHELPDNLSPEEMKESIKEFAANIQDECGESPVIAELDILD